MCGVHADDALAVEFEHQAQRGVRGGVLRAEVQHPAIAVQLVADEVHGTGLLQDGHGGLRNPGAARATPAVDSAK